MPQYEFNNKETGESVGELFLSLEGLEDFLRQNPNLCVAPGKLRYLQFKSDESFPSYPDMDNQTRTVEERDPKFVPAQPASWSDTTDPTENYTRYKVTDKRKNKISHFQKDIEEHGYITGAPKFLGGGSEKDFHVDSVTSNEPITIEEQRQYEEMQEAEEGNSRRAVENRMNMKGLDSKNPIKPTLGSQQLMPWEEGFTNEHAEAYKDSADEDTVRIHKDKKREYEALYPDYDPHEYQ